MLRRDSQSAFTSGPSYYTRAGVVKFVRSNSSKCGTVFGMDAQLHLHCLSISSTKSQFVVKPYETVKIQNWNAEYYTTLKLYTDQQRGLQSLTLRVQLVLGEVGPLGRLPELDDARLPELCTQGGEEPSTRSFYIINVNNLGLKK